MQKNPVGYFHVLQPSSNLIIQITMPNQFRRKKMGRSKFVTKRQLPFLMSKIAEPKQINNNFEDILIAKPATAATNGRSLTTIAQGDGKAEREGNLIQVTGYFCSFAVESEDTLIAQWLRIIIYTPRKVGTTLLPADDMTSQPDTDKFIIWHDKTVAPALQPGGGVGLIKLKKRWVPYMKVRYDSGADSSVQENEVIVLVLSHLNEGVKLRAQMRLFYRDM